MKRLIVNADDFGMSESINEGIVESHVRGIVTATTWMANGDAATQAAGIIPQSLDVGLHLALQDVPPLCNPDLFNSLLSPEGRFPSGHGRVVSWVARNRHARAAIRQEWLTQLSRFKAVFGQPPTHIDSHKHIALFPPLQGLLLETAAEAGNVRVRTPVEVSHVPSSLVFSTLGKRLKRKAKAMNLPGTESFLGYRDTGRLTQSRLGALLRRVRKRLTELMVHPGAHDEPAGYHRRAEQTALTSEETRRLVEALGILLVSPSELV